MACSTQQGKAKRVVIGIIVVLLLVAGGVWLAQTPQTGLGQAPDFTLEDLSGNQVSLADFEGKALVINSWATWCEFCLEELPDFAQLQEEFGDDIAVIAINRRESREQAKQFTDELEVTDAYSILLDEDDTFYRAIGGFGMPETLFVDSAGTVRIHKRGFMLLEEMRENVRVILNQKTS